MDKLSVKKLRFNVLYAFNGHIIIRILRAAYIFLLIGVLSPEDYGAYQYSHVWFTTYTPLTLMGLGILLSLNVAKNNTDLNLPNATLALRICSSIALSLVLFLIGIQYIELETAKNLLIIFLPILLIRALLHWGKEICIAYEKMNVHFYVTVFFSIFQIIAILMLENIGADIYQITKVYIAILCVEILFLFGFINSKVIKIGLDFSLKKFYSLIKQSWLIALISLGVKFIIMSPILLSGSMEASDIAILAGITMITFFASLVIEATNNAALPFLSKAGVNKKTLYYFWRALRLPVISISLVSILIALEPSMLISLLGDEYLGAEQYVMYIPILLILNFISMVIVNIMLVKETQKQLLFSVFIGCSYLIYSYLFKAPEIGSQLQNAAIAFSILITLSLINFLLMHRKELR